MLLALSLAKLQSPSLPMLWGPMLSQPQGPARMNKLPRLMRPLAQIQYHYQGMRTLLQWPVSQTYEESKVLTGSLHTIPDIHRLFNLHKCDWIAGDPGTYSEEIFWEFYASYAATLCGLISKQSKPISQDPLTSTMVSPTKADNQLTCDKAVIVAALVAGVDIDFARMLLAEIHERPFKTSTTYPFPYHIDIVPASSSQDASRAPSSSRSTPPLGATVVPLARLHKLEAQMATLLHHI
ncbi:hypothetical protein H5410_021295 [Solanum commersonii]|uniref:Uncharacterized protein n=1 Tax=Solanum commersonii TaxID=4109 RepID=A0A9J5ZGR6_SOLCO|nr:hypothetical protein H5410_021295 [Solanum commersonii]